MAEHQACKKRTNELNEKKREQYHRKNQQQKTPQFLVTKMRLSFSNVIHHSWCYLPSWASLFICRSMFKLHICLLLLSSYGKRPLLASSCHTHTHTHKRSRSHTHKLTCPHLTQITMNEKNNKENIVRSSSANSITDPNIVNIHSIALRCVYISIPCSECIIKN